MKKFTGGKIAQNDHLRKTCLIGPPPRCIGRESLAFENIRRKRLNRTWRAITNSLNRDLRYRVTTLETPPTQPARGRPAMSL